MPEYDDGRESGVIDRASLVWGLDRLATWGESADPHVRAECSKVAQQTFEQIAYEVEHAE